MAFGCSVHRPVVAQLLPTGGEFLVNSYTSSGQQYPTIAATAPGDFVVTWQSFESRGEWSVAKQAYVALRSGWFSTRSAAYLACGKPAVLQDTGFSRYYPTGEAILALTTIEESIAALAAVEGDYARHCEAARAAAEKGFAAETVLTRLLHDAEVA